MLKSWQFVIIGPGIISGPWCEDDYLEAIEFMNIAHFAQGRNPIKMGDWTICWGDTANDGE